MKKKVYGKTLSRVTSARLALRRSLVRAVVENGSIKTTKAKAKFVKSEVDSLIGIAQRGDIASRRAIYARLANDRKTTDKLFRSIAPAFKRKTGFTKLERVGVRRGDSSEIYKLSWVKEILEEGPKIVKKKKITKPAKKSPLKRLKDLKMGKTK